jgi:hypothetical protein
MPDCKDLNDLHRRDPQDFLPQLLAVLRAAQPLDTHSLANPELLAKLLTEPEETIRWLVEGRLPIGGLSLLAGKPKAGKSTLARVLALAVARGEPWLGWETMQGSVVYLAFEEKRSEVRAHFAAMGATDENVRVFIATSPEDGMAQLRTMAERDRPALIIVDPLFRLVRQHDNNDYAETTRALEPLLVLARETGAHVLAVHHLGKSDRAGGDAILGSTAIFGIVDTALLLRRGDRYRTLEALQRYGEDIEEFILRLDPETRVVSAGPGRQEAEEDEAARDILACLERAEAGTWLGEAAIHETVEGRKTIKQRALRKLVAEGRVARMGGGRRGDPYRYSASRFSVSSF